MRAEDIKAGWRIVTGILVGVMILQLLNILLSPTFFSFVWFAAIGLLCWNVYQGKVTARLLLGAFLVLNCILPILMGGAALAVGLLTLGCAVALFAVPQVNTYFEFASNQ